MGSERVWHPAWAPEPTRLGCKWKFGDREVFLSWDDGPEPYMWREVYGIDLGDDVDGYPSQSDVQCALRWLVGDEDEPVRTGGE